MNDGREVAGTHVVVAAHGGFDPVHPGHIRYLTAARALGDELVVILNNDEWLKTKKGFVFMPEEERKEVLLALQAVDRVVITGHAPNDPDRTIRRELRALAPDIFVNGGDPIPLEQIAEKDVCDELGIRIVVDVGGGKIQSSSALAEQAAEAQKRLSA